MKKQEGITLVALVITIIILVILAGITIAALTGENGLFTRSKEAGNAFKNSQDLENERLDSYNAELNEYFDGTNIK